MAKTAGSTSIDIHGDQNVTITGDVHGNVSVTYRGRDVRGEELAYLDGVIERYQYWAEKYTPLAGIAEVRAAAKSGPRLDLPMLFMPTGFEKLEEHGFGAERRTEHVPVDDLREAVARYKRLALLGEPGSGKTTTLWRLAFDYAVAAREDPHAPMPLLAPLGGYTGPESALTYAQSYFEELGPYLSAYLRSRRVILLLDALNEMPQDGYKERVSRIQALLDQCPNTPTIVTCRALDYVETLRLEKLEVKPLDPGRQRAYLHRYLDNREGETLFWQMAGEDVAHLWQVWHGAGATWEQFLTAEKMPEAVYGRTSGAQDRLWERMQQGWLPPLWVLGRNPFMLVMLAQVYAANEGALPPNRGRLFAAFADTLLGREEKRCEPLLWPGADPLRRALAQLAYAMQSAGERGTAVEAGWAKTQLVQRGVDTDRIAYLCASATLLDSSNSQVRFVHQLVQEYFAALALAGKLQQGDDLRRYWPRDWTQPGGWEETFVLLAGMIPDMTPLIGRLLPVNPVVAARCIAESGGERPDESTIRQVQDRLAGIAASRQAPTRQRAAAGDALSVLGDERPGVGVRADGVPDIEWCAVPAGEFVMGNTKQTDPEAYDDEMPQHRTTLAVFAISKYPITNVQYDAFVQDGGYSDPKWRECWTEAGWRWKGSSDKPDKVGGVYDLANHPVVGVSWYEAYAFSQWLGRKLGRDVRLPSEGEWERAARHTDGRRYPWQGREITPDHANYDESGIGTTTAVGIFPLGAAECGALDMSGNAWEWCLTKWRDDYTTLPDDGVEGDITRVVRGGSYYDGARLVRCAVRNRGYPDYRNWNFGFRVVVASP